MTGTLSPSNPMSPGVVQMCWSCRGPVTSGDLFCATCDAVQPPGQIDHFARLQLDVSFDVDTAELDRRYFALQRRLHPDRFASKGSKERALSQSQATSLNDAYETLKDPLARADYMVHLKGVDVLPEGCNLVSDPSILMESMEVREALERATLPAEVDVIANTNRAEMDDCLIGISKAFAGGDIEGACSLTTRLKYLRKLFAEIRVKRAKLAMMAKEA